MRLLAESFYDSVLRELVFALGAALFVANAYALVPASRRRRQSQAAHRCTYPAGSPVRGSNRRNVEGDDLVQAPVARTVAYLVIGFVVMVAGLGAMLNK